MKYTLSLSLFLILTLTSCNESNKAQVFEGNIYITLINVYNVNTILPKDKKKLIMKNSFTIVILTLSLFACSNSKMNITNQGVAELILGESVNYDYNKSDFDVTLDSEKKIKTIIINSEKYKTKDGFGIGNNFQDLQKKYPNNTLNKKFNANKGKISVINLGQSIIIDNIIFVDKNKDKIIDYIILNKLD